MIGTVAVAPFVIKGGHRFRRCPKAWTMAEGRSATLLAADCRTFIEHRSLPAAGGMLDQDPKFVEAVDIYATQIGASDG